jgi:hypothetical protein
MIINPYIYGITFDTDAQNVIEAIQNTGVTLTSIEKISINQLVNDYKSYGLWVKTKAIYGFKGGFAAPHRFNWKDPRTVSAAYYLNFFGGGIHSSNGWLPNNLDAYADTQLIPSSVLSLNNTHISIYSRTNIDSAGADIGAVKIGDQANIQLSIKYANTPFNSTARMYSSNEQILPLHADSLGLFTLTRTSSTSFKYFKRSTIVGTNTTTSSGTLPTWSIYLGALNSQDRSPSTISYGSKEIAFVSIGDGLADVEVANLNTLVQAFQTSNNRQV